MPSRIRVNLLIIRYFYLKKLNLSMKLKCYIADIQRIVTNPTRQHLSLFICDLLFISSNCGAETQSLQHSY